MGAGGIAGIIIAILFCIIAGLCITITVVHFKN